MGERLTRLRRKIEEEERLAVLREAESAYADAGVVPRLELLPVRRWRRALETVSAIVLGLVTGAASLLLTFGVVNLMLHLAL